jgi:tetratricopeptide (TPR) repeat protein
MIRSLIAVCCYISFVGCLAVASSAKVYDKIDNMIAQNNLHQAMPLIEKEIKKSPSDLELYVRKARVVTLKGDQSKNSKEKVKSYEEALELSNKMIKLDPKSAKGYLRRAVAKGKLILFKGILESRSLVLELRADAKKAIKLPSASTYEKALGNYLLGKAHLKLAEKPRALRMPLGLAWASTSKGGQFLKTAVELAPNSIPFTLDYGIWLKDQGKKAQAVTFLKKIEDLEVYDPADPGHKATANKLLASMK